MYPVVIFLFLVGALFGSEHKERFERIYRDKLWGVNEEGEGFSGGGSLFKFAKPYYNYLVNFLQEHQIKSVVDLGCGDWEFSKYVDWRGIEYHGYDIVDSVIEKDQKLYGNEHIKFYSANFLEETIPNADLMICKHVLQHLTNEDVFQFITLLPKFKHVLILETVAKEGVVNGEFPLSSNFPYWQDRGTDLTLPPFNVKGERVLCYESDGSMQMLIYTGCAEKTNIIEERKE